MWRWCVVSEELGRVSGVTDDPKMAADWVQMFMERSPGMAEGSITGPHVSPTALVSLDGIIREGTYER